MSYNNFIPALWSGTALANLRNDHVYKQCTNQDYEGEIKNEGTSLKIISIGEITINAHTRGQDITAAELLDLAGQVLLIDRERDWNFTIDDIDKAQAKSDLMSKAMASASWAIAEDTDDYLAGVINASVATANTLPPATVGIGAGEADAFGILVQLQTKLNENNVPKMGRWVVVPSYYEGMLMLDPRVSSFGTPANRETYRGDPLGKAAGFTIYSSNNTPSGTTVLAGYKGAVTFAEQLLKVVPYQPEKRFEDAVKGLYVCGSKVTRPNALAKIVTTQGSFS